MSKSASDLPGVVSRELAVGLQPADQRLTGRTGSAQLAAQLAPEPIPFILFTAHTDWLPEPLATAAGDPLAFAELVRLLRQRALVRISADDLQLHRLVHTIRRTRPGNGPDADAISRTALGTAPRSSARRSLEQLGHLADVATAAAVSSITDRTLRVTAALHRVMETAR